MGRLSRRLSGRDARDLAWAEKGLRELQTKNDALEQALAAFRARAGKSKDFVGCQNCGYEEGHSPECRYRHLRPAGRVVPCPECGGTCGIHKHGCEEVELYRVQRRAREALGPTGRQFRPGELCPTETKEFISMARPKPLIGWAGARFGCWYWTVAGRQFCCAFRQKEVGASDAARLALVRYVKGSLPEPVEDSGSVVGPCCVPEGGDFPKPMPPEKSDD